MQNEVPHHSFYMSRIAKEVSEAGNFTAIFRYSHGYFWLGSLRFYFCQYKCLRNVSFWKDNVGDQATSSSRGKTDPHHSL